MRLVFMGSPDPAVTSLEALLEAGHEVAAVVAQSDKGSGRGRRPKPPPVKTFAEARGLPLLQPGSWKSQDAVEGLRSLEPKALVVVAYGRILPPPVLDVAPLGSINVHFSLLPRWRGAAPVQRCILAGDETTGVTTMRMDPGLDTGPILLQERTAIEPDETAPRLESRLALIGATLLVETLAGLEAGRIEDRPQDGREATKAPMIRKEEGLGDWSLSAADLHRRWRAFHGWPGLYTFREGKRLVLEEIRPGRGGAGEDPGIVIGLEDGGLAVACGEGCLVLDKVRPEGRRAMSARDARNGRFLAPGDRLGAGPGEAP